MKTIPIPGFGGPTYLAVSPVMNAERSINLYPEMGAANSKSPASLVGRPGLGAPLITLATSPVRALFAGDNRLFAVSGDHAYEIGSAGVVVWDFGAMAGSTGVGPAVMIANGTQLLVLDRSAGQIFNCVTGVSPNGTSTAVRAAIALGYLDGFFIALDEGNLAYVSDYLDGSTWNALNVVQLTGGSDAKNQLAVLNGQIWFFGQRTIEVWYNAGNPLFPFARVPGGTLNFGCLAPDTVIVFHDTIMWLGNDTNGFVHVYQSQGVGARVVSTPAIENMIGGVTAGNPSGNTANLPYSHAHAYTENGHTFWCLSITNSSYSPQSSVVYDLTTGMWHERTYTAEWPTNYANVPGVTFNVTGPALVGDGFSGKILYQGSGYPSDNGTDIVYTRTFPTTSDRQKKLKYPMLQLDCDIGAAQPVLKWSNDGGKTFPRTLAAISGSAETAQGAAARFIWRQLGAARQRVFSIVITTSTELVRLVNAYLGVTPGTET